MTRASGVGVAHEGVASADVAGPRIADCRVCPVLGSLGAVCLLARGLLLDGLGGRCGWSRCEVCRFDRYGLLALTVTCHAAFRCRAHHVLQSDSVLSTVMASSWMSFETTDA